MGRNESSIYEGMPATEVFDLLGWFEETFRSFAVTWGYPEDIGYSVSLYDLIEVIVRVDKREAYFHFFHNRMEINERKQIALFAFWILKFKPFRITDIRYQDKINNVNEEFATYLIYTMLYRAEKLDVTFDWDTDRRSSNLKNFTRKLEYAFRYRDISMDAMLLLVESINTESFHKEYQDIS